MDELGRCCVRKTNTVWNHLYVEYKKYNMLVNITKGNRVTGTQNKLVVMSEEREGGRGKIEIMD